MKMKKKRTINIKFKKSVIFCCRHRAHENCSKQFCKESRSRRDSLAQMDPDALTPKFNLLQQRSLGLMEVRLSTVNEQ